MTNAIILSYSEAKRKKAKRYVNDIEAMLYQLSYAMANLGRWEECYSVTRCIRNIEGLKKEHSHAQSAS